LANLRENFDSAGKGMNAPRRRYVITGFKDPLLDQQDHVASDAGPEDDHDSTEVSVYLDDVLVKNPRYGIDSTSWNEKAIGALSPDGESWDLLPILISVLCILLTGVFWVLKYGSRRRGSRLCGIRCFPRLSQKKIYQKWQSFGQAAYNTCVIAERDQVLRPRRAEWSQLGRYLSYLKRVEPRDIYLLHTVVERPFWSALGRLLQRHPWAQDIRRREAEDRSHTPLLWQLGNGQRVLRLP